MNIQPLRQSPALFARAEAKRQFVANNAAHELYVVKDGGDKNVTGFVVVQRDDDTMETTFPPEAFDRAYATFNGPPSRMAGFSSFSL